MPLTVAERNNLADNEGTRITHLSLHTADPGTTGANEATGGTPAYARKPVTWGSAASGTATSVEVTFDVPAGTYPYFGGWNALTAGTFRGGNALAISQVISSQGQIKLTVTIPVTAS
jgi:hypothetical protein